MKIVALLLLSLAIGLGVVAVRQRNHPSAPTPPEITVLCDSSLQAPLTLLADAYRRELHAPVQLRFSAPAPAAEKSSAHDLLITTASPETIGGHRELLTLAASGPPAPAGTSNRLLQVTAALPTNALQSAAALRFARYCAAPEKGGPVFKSHGFPHTDGDRWAEKPDLILYSGGVNRPAIEKLLKQFADREGINITTVFNGCGVLCATMKAMNNSPNSRFPDAYYACDLCFVPPVAAQFPEAILLTETDIGIVVKKGNPRNVRTLADLAQPNLKIGLCNAEQSTLGYMTKGMLRATGLLESVRKNVAAETPTADFLINQMRVGALDAAVVYRVNAIPQTDHLDYFPIQHAGAKAIQPFAVRERSPNRHLARRLLDFLKANQREFETAGFLWRGNEKPIQSKDIQIPPWLKPDPATNR